jgi:hypothetical protein
MLTKDQMIAFASFLLCERDRHEEDIRCINKRLRDLKSLGVEAERPATWISDKDLGL